MSPPAVGMSLCHPQGHGKVPVPPPRLDMGGAVSPKGHGNVTVSPPATGMSPCHLQPRECHCVTSSCGRGCVTHRDMKRCLCHPQPWEGPCATSRKSHGLVPVPSPAIRMSLCHLQTQPGECPSAIFSRGNVPVPPPAMGMSPCHPQPRPPRLLVTSGGAGAGTPLSCGKGAESELTLGHFFY